MTFVGESFPSALSQFQEHQVPDLGPICLPKIKEIGRKEKGYMTTR